jgi:hypothetical protein
MPVLHDPWRRSAAGLTAGVLTAALLLIAEPASRAEAASHPSADVAAGARALPDTGFVSAARETCDVYIAPNGADTAAGGGAGAPLAHLSYAMRRLTAGKVACLAPGTYDDAYAISEASGTPTAPIVVRSIPGATSRPILRLSAPKAALWINHGYWLVDGLEFDLKGQPVSGVVVHASAHHVVLRNSVVRDGGGGAGVYVSGDDVAIESNVIGNLFKYTGGKLDDAHGVAVTAGAARVRVSGNRIHDNSGDGVQCEYDGAPTDGAAPVDLTIEDNRFWTDPVNYGKVEQGVDIKACRWVSIRGSVAPDADDPNAANQKFYGFVDTPGGRGGGAIVLHIGARNVLVENNRIWNSCNGVIFGDYDLSWPDTESVTIRRNVIFNLSAAGGCPGEAIFAQRAQHVDVYHNTIDRIPGAAVVFGTSNGVPSVPIGDFDFWNNIVRDAGSFVRLSTGGVREFASDNNLFYRTDNTPSRFVLNGTAKSLGAWQQSLNGSSLVLADAHSRVADPLFVPGAGEPNGDDYYTGPGSPARDTALPNTASTVSGAGPDIGFRETYASCAGCTASSAAAARSRPGTPNIGSRTSLLDAAAPPRTGGRAR